MNTTMEHLREVNRRAAEVANDWLSPLAVVTATDPAPQFANLSEIVLVGGQERPVAAHHGSVRAAAAFANSSLASAGAATSPTETPASSIPYQSRHSAATSSPGAASEIPPGREQADGDSRHVRSWLQQPFNSASRSATSQMAARTPAAVADAPIKQPTNLAQSASSPPTPNRQAQSISDSPVHQRLRSDEPVDAGSTILRIDSAEPPLHRLRTELLPSFITEYRQGEDEPGFRAAFQRIAERIQQDCPPENTAAVVFAAAHNHVEVDLTTYFAANELARRDVGRVLLVDANVDQPRLTQALGCVARPGLAEVILRSDPPEMHHIAQADAELYFLPIGTGSLTHRTCNASRMAALASHLRRKYQYICISGGSADNPVMAAWARHCDATYLVVNMAIDDQDFTQAATSLLRRQGSRLLGCVAAQPIGEAEH